MILAFHYYLVIYYLTKAQIERIRVSFDITKKYKKPFSLSKINKRGNGRLTKSINL